MGTPVCRLRLIVDVEVDDPARLLAYARRVFAEAWQGDYNFEQRVPDLGEAAMQALVISNENPSPCDYGLIIEDHQVIVLAGDARLPAAACA